jgi:hypothetical protein
LTPKRKIRDGRKNKKDGREQGRTKEEDIVLDKNLLINFTEKEDPQKRAEGEEVVPEDGEFFNYGKTLSKTRRRNKVDVTI